jgi:hypothetical protein
MVPYNTIYNRCDACKWLPLKPLSTSLKARHRNSEGSKQRVRLNESSEMFFVVHVSPAAAPMLRWRLREAHLVTQGHSIDRHLDAFCA